MLVSTCLSNVYADRVKGEGLFSFRFSNFRFCSISRYVDINIWGFFWYLTKKIWGFFWYLAKKIWGFFWYLAKKIWGFFFLKTKIVWRFWSNIFYWKYNLFSLFFNNINVSLSWNDYITKKAGTSSQRFLLYGCYWKSIVVKS